jgi:hypothetical protein
MGQSQHICSVLAKLLVTTLSLARMAMDQEMVGRPSGSRCSARENIGHESVSVKNFLALSEQNFARRITTIGKVWADFTHFAEATDFAMFRQQLYWTVTVLDAP